MILVQVLIFPLRLLALAKMSTRDVVFHKFRTVSNANASAAAAVLHRARGLPEPKPRSVPSLATTAMPRPVGRNAVKRPWSIDPSQYQVASQSS